MIVRTGKRAPPPYLRPRLTPAGRTYVERELAAALHHPIDVQGNVYSGGLGDDQMQIAVPRPLYKVGVTGFHRLPAAASRMTPGFVSSLAAARRQRHLGGGGLLTAVRARGAFQQALARPRFTMGAAVPGSLRAAAGRAAMAASGPRTLLGDLGDPVTGITAVDAVVKDLQGKAKDVKLALQVATGASLATLLLTLIRNH